jgi:hypothetical protein
MSPPQPSRSPDLQRLRDDGYEVDVVAGHLVVSHVPFADPAGGVGYGRLISVLTLNADVTVRPGDHVAYFAGGTPCDTQGAPLRKVINTSGSFALAPGLAAEHLLSSKPDDGYTDYHHKMTTYIGIIAAHAQALDPAATATTFPVIEDTDEASVFRYVDSASSRAGIVAVSARLAAGKVAFVGVGGTGSYALDLVVKTPVPEIHLFDKDLFQQHNAFRGPGAASIDELRERLTKVEYWRRRYAPLRGGIFAHPYDVDESNVAELKDMTFVFLTMEGGAVKRRIVQALHAFGVPFVDVGLGVYETNGALGGIVRVTASTGARRDHVLAPGGIPFPDDDGPDDYDRNIQIADLNALNAALAVIRWKKHAGFYSDLEREHSSTYTIDGNHLLNEHPG